MNNKYGGLLGLRNPMLDLDACENVVIDWTAAGFERFEKRKAALHEAGHATVAAARFGRVSVSICKNKSGDGAESSWLGKTQDTHLDAVMPVAGIVAVGKERRDGTPHKIADMLSSGDLKLSNLERQFLPNDHAGRMEAIRAAWEILDKEQALFWRIVGELLYTGAVSFAQMDTFAAEFLDD